MSNLVSLAQEKQIFLSALDFRSPAEREAYLTRACQSNPVLRQMVEGLLAAHERAGNILDRPLPLAAEVRRRVDDVTIVLEASANVSQASSGRTGSAAADRVGELVGGYRLLENIGEGGFGQVYVAQQEQPVRRRVAVKLLKPGMDSKEILARFEAERQALAMMEHPHIAKVFDAGSTALGQPFFAMELVRGVPITKFCEQQRQGMRQRLELFIDVCLAVQHAHQKGVIHRDLKPSNVMVTLHDAKPLAKVIDFGVAKAIGEPLTNRTIYTRFMQMIGTPMYMSPEQAEMNSLDVDTRSDVFSLGMLLYELLTGSSPYDEQRLGTASFDELRRIIREEELPMPSHRVSTLGKLRTTVSEQRRATPLQLISELRGDLDWIVMKAIEKDRSRRYESASALARDIRRHLEHEPIEARPPSNWYRFTKFAYRHKVSISAASLVAIALLLGAGVSFWQAARAVAERDEKEIARADAEQARRQVEDFALRLKEANTLLISGRAHADVGRWRAAAADYTRATEIQPKYFHVWVERGAFYIRLGLWDDAAADYAKALELAAPVSGAEWWGGPQLLLFAGDETGYRAACQRIWEESSDNAEGPTVWAIRSCLFAPQNRFGPRKLAEAAERLVQRANDLSDSGHGHESFAIGGKSGADGNRGEHGPRAKERHRKSPPEKVFSGIQIHKSLSFPPGVGLYLLGLAHYREGEYQRAIEQLKASLTEDPKWAGKSIGYPALAMAYYRAGQEAEARTVLAKANEVVDGWTTAMLEGDIGITPVPWFDYIECLLLQREATALLTGAPPAADPRWLSLQERAQAAIR